MASSTTSVLLGSVLGLTSSAIFFGANLGISFIAVPTLLLPSPNSTSSDVAATKSPHLAHQWQSMYDIGKKAGPFFALLATGSWAFAAQQLDMGSAVQQRLLITAAGLSVAIVPFTKGVMGRTNDELMRRASAAVRGEEGETKAGAEAGTVGSYQTHELLRWWAKLNLM